MQLVIGDTGDPISISILQNANDQAVDIFMSTSDAMRISDSHHGYLLQQLDMKWPSDFPPMTPVEEMMRSDPYRWISMAIWDQEANPIFDLSGSWVRCRMWMMWQHSWNRDKNLVSYFLPLGRPGQSQLR